MITSLPCVIFAGGKSSRMGEDKSLLPFANFKTLTEFQLSRFQKYFKNVYISTKDSSKFDFEANFIEDIQKDVSAPTVGFFSIFEKLKSNSFFAISVDTPFIDEDIIKTILQQDNDGYDATIATLNKKMQPLCGIYHKSLHVEFKQMLKVNNHKLGYLLKNRKTKFIDFTCKDKFLNMNYKDDYEKAKQWWTVWDSNPR